MRMDLFVFKDGFSNYKIILTTNISQALSILVQLTTTIYRMIFFFSRSNFVLWHSDLQSLAENDARSHYLELFAAVDKMFFCLLLSMIGWGVALYNRYLCVPGFKSCNHQSLAYGRPLCHALLCCF